MSERRSPDRKSGNDTPTSKERSDERRITGIGFALGGLVVLITLLYFMREMLNPLVVAAAGAILLWPFRRNQLARAVLLAGGFLLVLWLFQRLAGILIPFVVAYILAYMLNPLLDAVVTKLKIRRWIGALALTILSTGLVALFFVLLVPTLVAELERLANDIFSAMSGFRDSLVDSAVLERLERAGLVDRGILVDNITELVQDRATAITNSIPDTVQRVVRSISSLIQFITIGAITPVLFYYTLLDYDAITARMIELFPRVRGSRSYLDVAGRVVGRYLRGQLTISAIAAVLVTIALTIFGVPFALVIGMLAGILNMIPNIGIVITQVIGILLALLFGEPGLVKALIVFLVLLGESLLEQSVLTPKIQGRKVGLHPVLILLSLFVFGSLMGLFGLLIAVPATALLVTAYGHWRHELTLDLGARQSQGALDRLLNWRSRAPGDRPSGAHPMRSQPDTMRAQALAGSGEVGEPGEPPPDMPDQAATGDVEEQL